MRKKPIIGLCGGIGAGKSRVAAEFERLGCLVVSHDRLNHEVLRLPAVVETLRGWWGDTVLGPEGHPDPRRIADIVFRDAAEKERLEGLLHPLILRRQADMIRAVEDCSATEAIVIDSPLLFESCLERECDTVVFVEASAVTRQARLRAGRGWNAEELQRRERWQISLDEKRSRSEFVVNNDGPAEHLRPQVAAILQTVLAR